jgi:hypothetical protein
MENKFKLRRHQALFDNNLPFCKPKVEESKVSYKRKPKHKGKIYD